MTDPEAGAPGPASQAPPGPAPQAPPGPAPAPPDSPGAASRGSPPAGSAPGAGAQAGRMPALRVPAYRRFLGGVFVANVGSWMQSTAQGWLVLQLTNSPGLLGVTSAVGTFPILFLSLFAGVLADRVDRRRLLVATSVASALVAGLLALLVFTGLVEFWQVLVLVLAAGVAQALSTPASQALVSSLVGRDAIGNAVALSAAQFNLSRIIGPALAGVAIAAGGIAVAIGAGMVAFFVLAVVLATLPFVQPASMVRAEAGLWSNLMDGIRYTRRDESVALLVLLAAVPALFVLNYLVLLPVYARDILAIGAPGLGVLTAGIGVGALGGALLVAVLRPSGGSGRLVLLGLAGASLALIVFALSRFVPLSVLALAVLGACQVTYYTTTNTLIQVMVPARLRGRVLSLYILTSWGFMPIGNLLAGAVAEQLGPTVALTGGGLLTLAIVAIVAVARPSLRHLHPGAVARGGAA